MKEYKDQPKNLMKKVEKVTKNVFKFRKEDSKFFNKKPENEHQELKSNDNSEDLVEELFGEINPMGLPIGDIKKKLQQEVQKAETIIEELKKISPDLNKKLINDSQKEIIGKNWWIMKIDDFLMDKNMNDLTKININLN